MLPKASIKQSRDGLALLVLIAGGGPGGNTSRFINLPGICWRFERWFCFWKIWRAARWRLSVSTNKKYMIKQGSSQIALVCCQVSFKIGHALSITIHKIHDSCTVLATKGWKYPKPYDFSGFAYQNPPKKKKHFLGPPKNNNLRKCLVSVSWLQGSYLPWFQAPWYWEPSAKK